MRPFESSTVPFVAVKCKLPVKQSILITSSGIVPMFQQILITFIFIVGGFSIIISIGQLFIGTRRVENFNLSALFFCNAVQIFQMGFLFSGLAFDYPEIMIFHLTISSLIGVLSYHAYFLVCQPEIKKPEIRLLYFVPSAAMLIPDVKYIISPLTLKTEILNCLYHNLKTQYSVIIRSTFIIVGIFTMLLFILLIRNLLLLRKTGKNLKITDISIVFGIGSIILALLFTAGYLLGSLLIIKTYCIALCVVVISAFMISQRRPEFLQIINRQKVLIRYNRSRLNGIDAGDVGKRLKELMEKEKLFTDDEISLKQLAEKLQITTHQLSQFINEKMNSNFHCFINQYRIDEAKRILISEPERSILSISYGVGFNSKSSFYRAFYQSTRKAPHVYSKEYMSLKSR